ncbi:MAG: substrate-binding domain-containing protein [Nevskia sp.]|nr:substrate-binding domain-containing protein [Nevskia sp.]
MTTSAYALPPGTPISATIYAGSGSMQANAHYWAVAQLLTNVDSYTDSASCADSGSWRILTGTTKAAYTDGMGTTIPSGTNIAYMLSFAGGTFANAIGAIANASTLGYPPQSAIDGSTVTCASSNGSPTRVLGSFGTITAIPDFGTSDEEVALFNNTTNVPGSYTTSGTKSVFHAGTPLTDAQVGNLSTAALYTNLMGLAVTNALYSGTHPKTSFSRQEITGILTGNITNWSQLYANDGTLLPNQKLILLDRAPGSGTKAAMNVYFLLNPTASGVGAQWIPENEKAVGGGPTPAGLSSPVPSSNCSSSVPSAYIDFNESSSTTLFQDLENLNTANCLAIGILGLEFAPELELGGMNPATGVANYQFAKINGVDPYARFTTGAHVYATYANELNGSYDLMFTNSFNYRTGLVNGVGHYLGDGSYNSVFINTMMSQLGNGAIPGGVSGQYPAGVPGILLDPAVSGAAGRCVTPGSRFLDSQHPPELVGTFNSVAGVTVPACNDQLR